MQYLCNRTSVGLPFGIFESVGTELIFPKPIRNPSDFGSEPKLMLPLRSDGHPINYTIHKFIWNLFKTVSRKRNADERKLNVDEFDFIFLILFYFFFLCEHGSYDSFVLKWRNDVMTPRCLCLLKRFFILGLDFRIFFSFNSLIVSIVLPHEPTSDWCQIGVWDKSNQIKK